MKCHLFKSSHNWAEVTDQDAIKDHHILLGKNESAPTILKGMLHQKSVCLSIDSHVSSSVRLYHANM